MEIPFSYEILFGSINEIIVQQSADKGLLVMGQQGNMHHSQLDHLGEHFQHIIHHVKVPVIAGSLLLRQVKRILLVYEVRFANYRQGLS